MSIVFADGGEDIGYALYCPQDDSIYLRQFFIARHRRREGLGAEAIAIFLDRVMPRGTRVELSVLASNPGAVAFWRAVGFGEYATTLEIRTPSCAEQVPEV